MIDGRGALLDPFMLFCPAHIIDMALKHCLRVLMRHEAPRSPVLSLFPRVSDLRECCRFSDERFISYSR